MSDMIDKNWQKSGDFGQHAPFEHRIEIGNDRLEFHPVTISDPVPTGQQILAVAGAHPASDHLVFQLLTNGIMEELRPDETVDLRAAGVEKFIIFRNDRSFRFILQDIKQEWGGTFISEPTLKKLAGVDGDAYGVWLELRDSEDKLLEPKEMVDLSAAGVERFRVDILNIEIHVNDKPVNMVGRFHTGLEIKQAAKNQKVPIQLDFVLSLEQGAGHDQTKTIGDDEVVKISRHSRFWAIDNDDNS